MGIKAIAVMVTLDTKAEEALYIVDAIQKKGIDVILVDVGVYNHSANVSPHIDRFAVAESAGETIAKVARLNRGEAVDIMAVGAREAVKCLYDQGQICAVLAIGGGGGTRIGTEAMKALPFGVPKLMLSTVASGRHTFDNFVGTKDVIMMHSVVDISGVNSLTKVIFNNAVDAICGMAMGVSVNLTAESTYAIRKVAVSMYGNTTPCVLKTREAIEDLGFEVIAFHANGTGGKVLENMVREGHFSAVLDITTHEILDELVGGIHAAGPDRLSAASQVGIPQVVVPGALDFITFGPLDEVPEKFRARRYSQHNKLITLVEATLEEVEEVGKRIAVQLNNARAKANVVIPLRGFSQIGSEGGALHNSEVISKFHQVMSVKLKKDVEVLTVDSDINDPVFVEAIVNAFRRLFGVS